MADGRRVLFRAGPLLFLRQAGDRFGSLEG
ncbi:MAG: hypothetical protein K0Q59_4230 [Paenibacillus sp.]|nr:hypothetical protein [Paenibacillus sp.]